MKQYTSNQVCEMLDISPQLLSYYNKTDVLKPIKEGHKNVYNANDISRYQFNLPHVRKQILKNAKKWMKGEGLDKSHTLKFKQEYVIEGGEVEERIKVLLLDNDTGYFSFLEATTLEELQEKFYKL